MTENTKIPFSVPVEVETLFALVRTEQDCNYVQLDCIMDKPCNMIFIDSANTDIPSGIYAADFLGYDINNVQIFRELMYLRFINPNETDC